MNVKAIPFKIDLRLDSRANKNDFFSALKDKSGFSQEIAYKKRFLFFDDFNDDYYVGFILNTKDFSSHCQFKNVGGEIRIELAELKDGVEYNFFLLHKRTLKGLYLTYYLAASVKILEALLKLQLKQFLSGSDEKNQTSVKLSKANTLTCYYILSPDTTDDVLNKFKSINSIEFVALESTANILTPDLIKETKCKLSFDQKKLNGNFSRLKESIKKFVMEKRGNNISVTGKNNWDETEVVDFSKIINPWWKDNYDSITQKINGMDIKNLKNHDIPKKLYEVINVNIKNKSIIERDS